MGSVGQLVGVPLLGFLVVSIFNPPPALAIGLILVAATSGGTTSNVMTYLARGNVALGLVLTVVTALATILTLPFWVGRALQMWGADLPGGSDVTVRFGEVASLLVMIIFIPVALGMLVRSRWPAVASRLERTVSLVSFVALFGLIIGIVISLGSEVFEMLAEVGPASLVLAVLAALLGLGLGMLFRLDRRDHLAFAMEFSLKNVTLSMLIALSALHSDEMALPSAVYGVVAYLPGLALLALGRRYVGALPPSETEPEKRPVVVGYAGSDSAWPALRWAAEEAVASHRPLRIVMAWGMPTLGITPMSEASDLDRKHAERVVAEAVSRLRTEVPGVEADGEVVRGKPAQGLLDASADASLVVVGNKSRSRVGRLMLGSVSSAVVTQADLPVVLVRSAVSPEAEGWRQGPVVVGVDGSAGSEAAVAFAFQASLRHGMTVVAVHTTNEPAPAVSSTASTGTLAVSNPTGVRLVELSAALQAGRADYPAVEVSEVIVPGRAADNIVEASRGAALTVVGSRGHGGFSGLLLGSVSRAVIEHAESPVAVVRAS